MSNSSFSTGKDLRHDSAPFACPPGIRVAMPEKDICRKSNDDLGQWCFEISSALSDITKRLQIKKNPLP